MSEELKPLVGKKVLVVDVAYSEYGPTHHEGTLKSYNVDDKGITLENVSTKISGLTGKKESDLAIINWNYVASVITLKEETEKEQNEP